jgi:hypothetical protein
MLKLQAAITFYVGTPFLPINEICLSDDMQA